MKKSKYDFERIVFPPLIGSRYGKIMAAGASTLSTKRLVQSNIGYSIVKEFENGLNIKALFETHYMQSV